MGVFVVVALLGCVGWWETDSIPDLPDEPKEGKGKAGKRPASAPIGEPGEGRDENDTPRPPAEHPDPPGVDGITEVGPNNYRVTSAKADAMEDNPSRLASASMTKAGGWKLSRVGADGSALGLRVGDVIREVNGYALGSDVELAIAYAALHDKKDFDVKIRRDGAVVSHHVQIED